MSHPSALYYRDSEYRRLIDRARAQRAEIQQIFTDVASWNDNSVARRNGCDPIDPDPDGQLKRIADAIDGMLSRESALGRLAATTTAPVRLTWQKAPGTQRSRGWFSSDGRWTITGSPTGYRLFRRNGDRTAVVVVPTFREAQAHAEVANAEALG